MSIFIFIALAIYALPNIYAYFRLKKLITNDRHKTIFTIIHIVLALSFPAAEILSHNTSSAWVQYFLLFAYYSLAFLLYLFLLLVLYDILRGINRLLKIVPTEVIRSHKFRTISLYLLFIFPAVVVIMGSVHYNTIRVKEYRVEIPRRSGELKHLKIAMAADFHLGQITRKQFLEKFANKINSLNVDILLIPGDIVEGHRDDGDMADFERMFRQIKSKYGVYASPGNHESHGRNNKADFFTNAGISLLTDKFVKIDNSFYLVGRNDRRTNNRKPIDQLLANMPNHLPVILLDHRPIDLEPVSKCDVDIQVSGHTHYGQLFPFNFIIENIYELGWGYKRIRDTHFFVTSGIQMWGPPVRTAGNSEIIVINVVFM